MNDDVRIFLGYPTDFKGLFKIYPPKIYDVLNCENFNKFLSLLTISQEDIEDQIFSSDEMVKIQKGEIPTPYDYFIQLCLLPEYWQIIKEGLYFFTRQEFSFLPEKQILLIGNLEEILIMIHNIDELPVFKEEDFFDLQNQIRLCLGMEKQKPYNYDLHPYKRRALAKARLRDRIKAKRDKKTDTLQNQIASICCMQIGLTPLNIGEMSYAAIAILKTKYQQKEKYDIDMKILTSGFADSKKIKPKYWMSELEKD